MYKNIGFCTFVQAHSTYSIHIEQMICYSSSAICWRVLPSLQRTIIYAPYPATEERDGQK